jgi:hypothetical protein
MGHHLANALNHPKAKWVIGTSLLAGVGLLVGAAYGRSFGVRTGCGIGGSILTALALTAACAKGKLAWDARKQARVEPMPAAMAPGIAAARSSQQSSVGEVWTAGAGASVGYTPGGYGEFSAPGSQLVITFTPAGGGRVEERQVERRTGPSVYTPDVNNDEF